MQYVRFFFNLLKISFVAQCLMVEHQTTKVGVGGFQPNVAFCVLEPLKYWLGTH